MISMYNYLRKSAPYYIWWSRKKSLRSSPRRKPGSRTSWNNWIPAFAGMTKIGQKRLFTRSSYLDHLQFSWEEKAVFFLKKPYNGRVVPCPGKKACASPKKAVVPLSPMRASAPCCRAIPFPPRLFAERKKEANGKVWSRPFLSSAPALLPGQRKDWRDRPIKLEMILIFKTPQRRG